MQYTLLLSIAKYIHLLLCCKKYTFDNANGNAFTAFAV